MSVQLLTISLLSLLTINQGNTISRNVASGVQRKGWLAIAKLKPLSLFISLSKAFLSIHNNVKIEN